MNEIIEKIIISTTDDSSSVKPTQGTKCIIKLTNIKFNCEIDKKFSLKRGETVLFHKNEELFLMIGEVDYDADKLLESAIKSMYPKEISDFKLKLNITRDDINYEVFIELRLELVSTIHIGYIHEWISETKLFIAARHKDKGVEFFKKKKIILAFTRFSKAVKLIISIGNLLTSDLGEENLKLAVDLKRDLYNNLALCRQNMKHEDINENYEHIAYLCEKVLEIDENNVKALMRLSKARMELKDYEQALEVTKRILILEPGNSVGQRDIVILTGVIKQQNRSSDQIVKRMFSNM